MTAANKLAAWRLITGATPPCASMPPSISRTAMLQPSWSQSERSRGARCSSRLSCEDYRPRANAARGCVSRNPREKICTAVLTYLSGMAQRRSSKVSRSRLRDSVGLLAKAAAWFAAHPDLWFAIFSACWVGLLYRHVIAAAFVYDDVPQISKNAALSSWRSVVGYFRSAVPFNSDFRGFGGFFYRPLFWASLALDRALWGLDAAGFHCTNLVLHWANGLLAFLLLKRLSVSVLVAAAVLLIWLGLPINAEVVAWISGRSISLAFVFLLTGLFCAECYLRSNGAVALIGYAIASLESLLSHEIGILTLPMTWVALYSANTARRRWLALSGVGVVVDALYLGLRYFAGAHISSGVASSVSSGVSVFVEAGVTFWKYVGWMVLPLRMSVERSTDVPTHSSALTLAA